MFVPDMLKSQIDVSESVVFTCRLFVSQGGGSAGCGECQEGNRNHAQTGHEGPQDHRQRGKSSRFLQLDSRIRHTS